MMEIVIIVGTRPEIIKMAPIIRALSRVDKTTFYLVHTDQHYDEALSGSFFSVLELPEPDEHFAVGSGTHHEQTSQALQRIGALLDERAPAAVLAQGDTNAVLSTAIAASKTSAAFGHVEAGLRSFDWTMPEEINRLVADAVADFAFAPTETAMTNLQDEGRGNRAYLTGNTIVDACLSHKPIAQRKSDILSKLGLTPDSYAVATIHRPFNTDQEARLQRIISSLDSASIPVIFPVHPRTQTTIDNLDIEPNNSLLFVPPLGYLDFIKLIDNSLVVVTDSGGVQEEASILEVPCLTVRPNTERPETVEVGVNKLVEPDELRTELETLVTDTDERAAMTGHQDLFGDGDAAQQIVDIIISEL
jgi:UDP-N-acetylglucosamine 2-epimerase (non-hydrolysing)